MEGNATNGGLSHVSLINRPKVHIPRERQRHILPCPLSCSTDRLQWIDPYSGHALFSSLKVMFGLVECFSCQSMLSCVFVYLLRFRFQMMGVWEGTLNGTSEEPRFLSRVDYVWGMPLF